MFNAQIEPPASPPQPPPPKRQKAPDSNTQLKNWCCTIYPDSFENVPECYEIVQAIGEDSKYAIFGKEICPTTKRIHLQGYVMFKQRIRFTALKKKYYPTIHWEGARGTTSQNVEYCSKEDFAPMEFGERPKFEDNGQREQERWKLAREAAIAGNMAVIPDQIFVAHYKNVKAIRDDSKRTQDVLEECCGVWLYGVPGSGKSTKARTEYGSFYFKDVNTWWDGYDDQDAVIIEDIDPSHSFLCRNLKIWADKSPFPAQVKGGYTQIRPKHIIVTSNYSIEEIFPTEIDQQALKRRFKVIYFPFPYGDSQPVEATPPPTPPELSESQETAVLPMLQLSRSKCFYIKN